MKLKEKERKKVTVLGRRTIKKILTLFVSPLFIFCHSFAQESTGDSARDFSLSEQLSVEEIVRRVLPSVAHIKAERKQRNEIFERTLASKSGTGFLIDKDGYILTNYHVVDDANRILVSIQGTAARVAQLVGTDPMLDIALLRIDSVPTDFVPAVVSDRPEILLGEEIVVVGHPFTLHNTVTRGVVSGLKRQVSPRDMGGVMELFQFDAALNPGNSGGPVLDRKGEVIGIATAMYPEAQGIGFAIPIQQVRRVLSDLKNYGHARRLWLGVMGSIIDMDIARLFGLPVERGFLVESIHKGSPADLARIRGGEKIIPFSGKLYALGGDIILAVDGTPVNHSLDMVDAIKDRVENEQISLVLLRNGQQMTVKLRLKIMPDALIAVPAEAHP